MEIKTLGELCNIVSGGTPLRSKPEYWNNGTIPWIKIGDMKGKYINSADEYITQAGLDSSSEYSAVVRPQIWTSGTACP